MQLSDDGGEDKLLMWIDAVCINQADTDERSRQGFDDGCHLPKGCSSWYLAWTRG